MRNLSLAGVALLALSLAGQAHGQVLYAPTQHPPELINAAPWNWNFTTLGPAAPAAGAAGTLLDTIPGTNSVHAGFNISSGGSYNNPLMPPISAATGYTVRIQVAVTAEQHADRNVLGDPTDDDRAGFSLIVIPGDTSKAIELAFFTDRIFSQNANFVGRGEQVAVNTIPLTAYDLTVLGNSYTLTSGTTQLLQGNLRTYNLNADPIANAIYSQTNWIFLGDDTSSAAATAEIAHVEILPVPEPASLTLLALCGLALWRRDSQQRSRN